VAELEQVVILLAEQELVDIYLQLQENNLVVQAQFYLHSQHN
jgi:hypothetical protein